MAKTILFSVLISVLSLSLGCVSLGTREIVMPDQEVLGNQGYLEGAPSSYQERDTRKKKIYDIEIEVPDLFKKDKSQSRDESVWGNQGYFHKGSTKTTNIYIAPKKSNASVPKQEEEYLYSEEVFDYQTPVVSESIPEPLESAPIEYTDYVVRQGDSLWIIAKRVYGDAAKWSIIAENNQGILKESKHLKPGTVLKIPVLGEDRSQYIK
jgi:LysM repeat protein